MAHPTTTEGNKIAELKQLIWEAYQFIGGSIVQEQSEQDCIDIMDKLSAAIKE